MNYLEFEKPLAEVEGKAEELRAMARANSATDVTKEAEGLDRKAETMLKDLYKTLTPWQKCQVARHPDRPHCKDYIEALFTEFTPLAVTVVTVRANVAPAGGDEKLATARSWIAPVAGTSAVPAIGVKVTPVVLPGCVTPSWGSPGSRTPLPFVST